MRIKMIKKAFGDSIPVLAGYAVLGLGFGVLAVSKGYGVLTVFLMSLLIYGGSMQYVGIELMSSGAGILSAALLTLMIHARHLFYGISMIECFKGIKKCRWYAMFALTDESYSILCNAKVEEREKTAYFLLVSLFNQLYWITGTVLGAALGNIIPVNTKGVEFAMTALFTTIFVNQWQECREHKYALSAMGISLLCLFVFGGENFLIPAMCGILLFLTLDYRRTKTGEGKKNGST